MGGSGSKPAVPVPDPTKIAFSPDYSRAQFSAEELQRQLAQASAQASAKAQELVAQTTAKTTASLKGFYTPILWILGLAILGFGLAVLFDYFNYLVTGKDFAGMEWLNFGSSTPGQSQVPESNILYISYARYGTDNSSNYQDVTAKLSSMIVGETSVPSFIVGWTQLGLPKDPYPGQVKTLYVEYYVGTSNYLEAQASDGQPFPQLPGAIAPTIPTSGGSDKATAPPSYASKIYNAIFGDSSGDLAPSYHDATSSSTIQGSQAPLSSQQEGGYGMQWWMYVKDWNYGYGKRKSVVKRPDVTNPAVLNPHISLHPTDNALEISVSVFPATEGGSSTSTPAPANASGSTDDVFVCTVPNIPLQTWFSVSVTIFGRNLDVYIDGKLVKSCFLTGVPKPAVGDIQLTPDGGFSGRICNFYHYPRMLTPADTATFYSAGTPCQSKTESSGVSKATGYSVKFGVYDALGKEVQEYAF